MDGQIKFREEVGKYFGFVFDEVGTVVGVLPGFLDNARALVAAEDQAFVQGRREIGNLSETLAQVAMNVNEDDDARNAAAVTLLKISKVADYMDGIYDTAALGAALREFLSDFGESVKNAAVLYAAYVTLHAVIKTYTENS